MKTLILAMAAVMALGAGTAFAGEGDETAVQAQWDRMNGINSMAAQEYYGYPQQTQQGVAQQPTTAPQRTSMLNGAGWNSNG